MKMVAALASILSVLLYLVLIRHSQVFTLFSPRGGIVPVIISLLAANAMVWNSQQPNWSPSTRFQLFVAGWIWIAVALGGTIYTINAGV